MKRILSLMLVLSMVLSLGFVGTLPSFAMEGTGIESDPYIITTAEELAQISSGFYKLGADITVNASIIGKGGFTLDGNNHTITLNNIQGTGLFATITGETTIKNLILEGSVVGSNSNGTGALIGSTVAGTVLNLNNVINYASVSASNYLGSLIGKMGDSTVNITGCENYGEVGTLTSGNKNYVGGIAGLSFAGTLNIDSTYNYGKIACEKGVYVGGFTAVHGTAALALSINITNCGNYGEIIADYMGGFVSFSDAMGNTKKVTIKNSFNAGKLKNLQNGPVRLSAFVGRPNNSNASLPVINIENCFNAGDLVYTVSGTEKTGGCFTSVGNVKNSYNAGTTTHFNRLGTTENCYYLEGTVTDSVETAQSVTDAELKDGLNLFSTQDYEYVTNPDASENYSYPQIKTNKVYYGYKTIVKDTKEYVIPAYSLKAGNITGAQANPFTYSEKLNDGAPVSAIGTYKGLGQTLIVNGNSFKVDKSAVIYIASKDSAINSQGFMPVLSTDGTTNAYVYDKYGVKYYLSSKTVLIENGTTDITTPSGTLNVFVGWLDNVKLSVAPSQNGEIYLDDVKITDETEKTYLKGQEIKLTITPQTGYYLKSLNVNSTLHSENIIEENDIFLALDSDISVTAEFKEYKPELKFEVLRETNSQGTIDQKVKLSGNAYDFMSGKVITLEIKNSQNQVVLTENKAVGGDGSFEIVKLFTYPSDNYIINAKINNLTFVIEDDSNNGTYYIPTITAINNLLTSLNGDTALINKTQLALDIETDRDLNFDVSIYKNLSTLKTDIVTRFLAYNDGAYSVDNIPERFATAVILEVMNNGTSNEIKTIAEYYENEYLKLKDETVYYADFSTVSADTVYSLMANLSYTSPTDVKTNFKNSVVIALIKNTFNSGNILPVLLKYKNDLNIPEITTIDNYTDYRQRKALEYLGENKGTINTYSDLKATLEHIALNIDTIAPVVILPPPGTGNNQGSSVTVSGGGGGGGSSTSAIGKAEDVTSKYGDVTNTEEASKPTGETLYFNDFSSETVGETPVSVSISGSSGSAIVVSDKDKGNCVKLTDTDEGYGGVDLARTFSAVDEPVAYEVEFQWLSGTGNVGMYVLMGNSGANAFQLVTNTANSNLSYENKNGNQNFPGSGIPLKKGEWYKVRVVLDVKNQTANFTVKSDAYKGINTNALIKSVTYDEKTNTIATGMIPLKGDFTSSISRVTFRTGRWESEFLVSYIKVETKPVDLIGKNEIKAPDAPTVLAPQPHAVEDEINIKLNGEYVYSYIKPIMRNDRVLVSVRNILEMFKMEVTWDEETETVTAKDDKNTVVLKNNDVNILVNGETKTTDVPAQLYGDRIYVPLRFLSECFGMTVDWDDATQTVIIGG